VCEICHFSGHDINFCPYHIFADSFARLGNMTETVNEQQIEFANYMQEYYLSHETNLKFSSPNFDVNSCDDDASFLTLESELEEAVDPPLTTLPLIAPSLPSALMDNTTFIIMFPYSSLSLALSI